MKRFVTSLAFALAALALAAPAAADVVGPPPDVCPDGADPASSHCGPYCRPLSCTTDADCAAGTCKDLALCVKTSTCGGWGTQTIGDVKGPCSSACVAPDACQTLKVCAKGTSSSSSSSSSGGSTSSSGGSGGSGGGASSFGGCGCRVGGEAAGEAALYAAIAGALVVAARRRRR